VSTPENPYRLPRTVIPHRYDLRLAPDLAAATFDGSEAIAVEVVEPTAEVVLNALDIEIDEAIAEVGDDRLVATVSLDEDTERATLSFDRELPAGPAALQLRFRGVLNDKLVGFYRSTFTDDDGATHVLATTQMEATDARRAFPCWDEPDAKAVFGVTLVVPADLTAVSNGGEIGREPAGDGRVAVRFADTMPMSTYLVAFVVGPLAATDPIDVDGKPLRVVCPPGKEHLADFALEVGEFSLRFFTDWFGMVYPGDKLDLVAIPDFAFGAMENLGCITFRERYLLVDPATATQAELQAVVDVIAHEIAHMWFGDLVTMKWWNGIWLNEAFATFMEMTCTDAFRPEWRRWVDFGLSRSAAFDTDALAATRPIEYPVVSPADADGMFDVLTYEKGASVVRMLERYLGAERFRDGIRRYMARHQYGNTETSDLWDALEAETGEPVRRIAESWIFQGGFPELVVTRAEGGLTVGQRRFGYRADGTGEGTPGAGDADRRPTAAGGDRGEGDRGEGDRGGAAATAEGTEARWSVPVVLGTRTGGAGDGAGGGTDERRVARLVDAEPVTLPEAAAWPWVNANYGAHGFYRVRYDPPLLEALLDNLADLTPLERYTLVDDGWAAVLAATADAASYLDTIERFADERDLSVWERITGGLSQIDRLVEGDAGVALHGRVAAVVGPARAELGADARPGDDDRTRTLRGVLLQTAALLGDDGAARRRARELLDRFLDHPPSVDPSLAAPALAVSATLGDPALHERLTAAYRASDNPQDRQRLLFSLARFRDPEAFRRTLELSLSDDVRTQDAPYLLGNAIDNRDNGPAAWAFVAEHWADIQKRFPANSLARLVGGIRGLRDRALAREVEAFLADHPIPQGELQVRQHVERMWVTVALAEREADRLAAALTG
jgi:puromycin-sensitive aminopeptidase